MSIDIQHKDLISVEPSEFNVTSDTWEESRKIYVKGIGAGHSTISLNVVPSDAIQYVYNTDNEIHRIVDDRMKSFMEI